jgi:outer membrane biosynthesis protein TonB
MKKKISQKIDQIKSLFWALIIHLLLLALIFWSFKNTEKKPAVVTLDISIIDDSKKEKKSHQHHQEKIADDVAKHFHAKSDLAGSDKQEKVKLVLSPLPEIPQDLRAEAFQSSAVARFYVDAKGVVKNVELIKPCNNPKLNILLLKSLRQWKFADTSQSFTQDIRVNFLVQ